MPSLTAFRAQLNTLIDINSAYPSSDDIITDRIQTGNNIQGINRVLTFGTGPGKGNLDYWERITFAPGVTDLDLLALATERPPSGSRSFSLIKYFALRVVSPVAGQGLTICGYGTNVWPGWLLGSASEDTTDDCMEEFDGLTGWPVDGSHHLLRINNPGLSVVADLILAGES